MTPEEIRSKYDQDVIKEALKIIEGGFADETRTSTKILKQKG